VTAFHRHLSRRLAGIVFDRWIRVVHQQQTDGRRFSVIGGKVQWSALLEITSVDIRAAGNEQFGNLR
jgi:hypothetical protein